MGLTVADLSSFTMDQMTRPFVADLDERKQFELASGTFLIAIKSIDPSDPTA